MERKKICFIVALPATANAFFKSPMEKLQKDFDIYLAANISNPDEVKDLPLSGYQSIRIERRPNFFVDLKALWQLYRFFRKERFFVVHSMASKPSLLTAIAGFMACVPHRIRIFTGQLWCNMRGLKRLFFKSIDKLTVLLDTEIMADGHPQARYLVEQKIVKDNEITVLANGSICGIDLKRFQYDKNVREKIRKEMGLQENVVFIFLGRLKKEKGVRELMGAFNRITNDCTNAMLLLVGNDEEHCHAWMQDYNNLKKGKNIIFYGATSFPNHLLMASDVFCNPSYREGFGLSVLEASCIGLPVICSDIYGMEDTFVDGITGLKCRVMDEASLAEQMKILYFDKKMREELGSNGHNRVEKCFSKELVSSAWYNYYKGLL